MRHHGVTELGLSSEDMRRPGCAEGQSTVACPFLLTCSVTDRSFDHPHRRVSARWQLRVQRTPSSSLRAF